MSEYNFKSKVRHHLKLPQKDKEFIRFTKTGSDFIYHTEYGHVHLGTLEGGRCEYFCNDLCEYALIIKLIWIAKDQRNKGFGRKLLRKVMKIFEDTNCAMLLYAYPVEMVAETVPPDTRVVDSLPKQRKLVEFYHSEGFEVAKYESVYIPGYLMEMIKRHQFHKVTPILMFKAAKNVPDVVREELDDIQLDKKIWSEKYMRDDQPIEAFNSFEYMSGEFLM
jgi:GNAT superfamily N-acetyltransferase